MKHTINNYNSGYDYPPLAWWLHLGDSLGGNVLVCGDIGLGGFQYLSALCKKVYAIDSIEYSFGEFHEITKISADDIKTNMFSTIIIDKYNNKCSLPENILSKVINEALSANGAICLYEKNQYLLSSSTTSFFSKIANLISDKKYIFYKKEYPGCKIEKYSSTTYEVVPYESFSEGMYSTNKNIFKTKEKIKNILMRTSLSRLISNSKIWVIRKNQQDKGIIELVLDVLQTKSYMRKYKYLQYSIIYYKSGKLIITFDAMGAVNKKYILVIATDTPSVEQRLAEMKTIEYLKNIEETKDLVVNEYYKEDISGFQCFIMEAYEGITVDIKTKKTQLMTDSAFKVLMRFTRPTLTNNYDCSERDKITMCYFDKMLSRLPKYSQEIEQLKDYASQNINRVTKLSVCMHGDFKLENNVLDSSYKVVGLIDWELSEINGLPLLDLYYLIIYNHQVRNSEDDFAAVFCKLLTNDISSHDQDMVRIYCTELKLNNTDKLFYLVVFFVHHFGCRFVYRNDYVYMNNFEQSLNALIAATKKSDI